MSVTGSSLSALVQQQKLALYQQYYDTMKNTLLGGSPYGNRQPYPSLYRDPYPLSNSLDARTIIAALTGSSADYRAERSAACAHEGVRAGEIIGWRAWKVKDDELHSTFHGFKWIPGALECVGGRKKLNEGYGFFAYKDDARARSEAINELHAECFAFGSIFMWGEIVEHETGYRSTHTAIRSIEFVNKGDGNLLERLRAAYVVPPAPLDAAA